MDGINLKIARIKQRRRQLELAQATGIHPTRLSKIENEWEQARTEEIVALCRELGLSAVYNVPRFLDH